MKIRMILTDLDGTLYGTDGQVSKTNVEALLEAQMRGILVVPASGRTFRSVSKFAESIGLTGPIISCNGARADTSPDGAIILNDTFQPEKAKEICDALLASGVRFALYGQETVYRQNFDPQTFSTRGLSLVPGEKSAGAPVYETDVERIYAEGIYEAYKFVAFSEDEDALNELKKTIAPIGAEISSSWRDNIEILREGASKGKALMALCERYGIPRDETMAFGDQLNDLEMLKAAGVPVAMGNAVDAVKGCARVIAPHHDESGVGRVIERYFRGVLEI